MKYPIVLELTETEASVLLTMATNAIERGFYYDDTIAYGVVKAIERALKSVDVVPADHKMMFHPKR